MSALGKRPDRAAEFDPLCFVASNDATYNHEWIDEYFLFCMIRRALPELKAWEDDSIGYAWIRYCRDVEGVDWFEMDMPGVSREELLPFAAYIHHHGTIGAPCRGISRESLVAYAQNHQLT